MQKTLFNRVFSDLKNIFGINMPSLCYYLTQPEDEAMEVWIRPTLALYKEYSGKKNKTSDDYLRFREEELEVAKNRIVHFTSSIVPSLKELNFFIDGFKKYLYEECNFSTHINEFYGRLGPILMYVNNQSRQQGLEDISLSVDLDFIGKLLWRAWVLSQPNSTIYPTLHFEDAKLQGSPYFIGREHLIDEIITEIAPESQDLNINFKSVYLQGIGGIGKTEVVRAVVQKLRHIPVGKSNITDIVWIDLYDGNDGEENGITQQSEDIQQKICMAFHSNSKIKNLDQEYDSCKQELFALGKGLLIVIDNIEVDSGEFRNFCKSLPDARFIIAGRPLSLSLPDKTFSTKDIRPLESEDCKALFKYWYGGTLVDGDEIAIDKIIDLADCHTVTIELFAKLIKKQDFYDIETTEKSAIQFFLETLKNKGFNLKFSDGKGGEQKDEPVSAEHQRMIQERRIIDQLAQLFTTMKLANRAEKGLLIKISTVPNIPFEFRDVKELLSLRDKTRLDSLSEAGWLQRTDGAVKTYSMHSIIAAAIRHENAGTLHDTCRSFIVSMTKSLSKRHYFKKSSQAYPALLIQFSWSIADIFGEDMTEKDADFLKALIEVYEKCGLTRKARYILQKLKQVPGYSYD